MRATDFETIIYKYLDCNLQMISEAAKDPNTPVKDHIVLKMVELALKQGNLPSINFLLDRSLGPLQNSVKADLTVGLYKLHDEIMRELEGGD